MILGLLACRFRSVSFADDPILGDPSPSAPCVQWHGDLSMEQGLPVIQVRKSGQDTTVPSYVCKLMSFLFADDESLKMLRQVRKRLGKRARWPIDRLLDLLRAILQTYQAKEGTPQKWGSSIVYRARASYRSLISHEPQVPHSR